MIKTKIKAKIAVIVKKIVEYAVKKGCIRQDDVVDQLSAVVDIKTDIGTLKTFCPGEIPVWRSLTFFEKEPETIDWINGFEKNDVFLDIGANVGLYSIYAGLKINRVVAVEPLSDNYFILQRNITLNKLKNVISYCIGLYDEDLVSTLKVRNSGFGNAENSFDEPLGSSDERYVEYVEQGCVSLTLDNLVKSIGVPNHIKIDVDGHEFKILRGAKDTLSNNSLKSVLIEINEKSSSSKAIIDIMESSGFYASANKNSDMFQNTKYANFKNYIFVRSEK